MRKLLAALGLLSPLVVLAAVAGAWHVRTAPSPSAADVTLPGLRQPVEVTRDSLAIPSLRAEDEVDLARAVGYVHAQDRLWQMELARRVGDGRLAQVLGPDALDSDRFLRTLGMGPAAAEEERALDEQSRRLLQAYAEGVNAWIDHHDGPLPPEFLALGYRPEPWTVRNSLTIGKLMSWDLADWDIGLELQRAVDRVGPELALDLVPRYPAWGPRILDTDTTRRPTDTTRRPAAAAIRPPLRPVVGLAPLPRIPPLAAALLGAASARSASNAWVVAGSRTRSGKPILANDPHLQLTAPSLWYPMALHGGRLDVVGVTFPGLPAVVLGHTPRVAWGFTNAMVDDVDFFVERVSPTDSTQYQTPTGWERFEVRAETIQVKGGAPVILPVRATRHGPVVSTVDPRAGDRVLAMQWSVLRPSTSFRAMLAMDRATSAAELVEALRGYSDAAQNVVFADADGTIGYQLAGRVPVRRSGDGLLPLPGWTGEGDWTGFLDFDRLPRLLNPARGFIVTANNAQTGDAYPYHIGGYYAEPYRAMRIQEMVAGVRGLTAVDVARQQMDVHDVFARRYLPLAIRAAQANADSSTTAELRAWDGEARRDSHAAAVFYLWYEKLRGRVGDDEYAGRGVFFPRYAMDRTLDAGGGPWVDDIRTKTRTETLAQLSTVAMRDAVRELAGRSWGAVHSVRIDHVLGRVDILAESLDLNLGPFPAPGSHSTVNVADWGGRVLPFVSSHGPSMRQVVDLSDPDGAGGFVIPTGVSGVSLSAHYRDQNPLWREGRLWPIPLGRGAADRGAATRTTLRP